MRQVDAFWDRPLGELLGQLHATAAGLTSDEAARRRLVHGPNSLVEESRFAGLVGFLRFFANPLVIVLVVASAISLALGDPVGGLIVIAMLLWAFHASTNAPLFRTGWFVESLATQTLVVFVIRTAGNPFRSRRAGRCC